MKFFKALADAIAKLLQTTTQTTLDYLSEIVRLPFDIFTGGCPKLPTTPPIFDEPVDPRELRAALANGHECQAVVHDLDRDGVNTVFKFERLPKADRDVFDLSAVQRNDVRALLMTMTTSELQALTKAGPGAVRLLLEDGDAKIRDVPRIVTKLDSKPTFELDAVNEIMREKLRATMLRKASKPYAMPRMPV